jgi:NADH:ubiquinone oxidoreductase subunit E
MLTTDRDRLRESVEALADKLGRNRGSLMPILQDVKKNQSGLDSYAMQVIADALGIHPVEVFSVATFYAFLHPEKEGRFVFRLCRTLSCDLQGKEQVARQLRNDLGLDFGQTSADGNFTLEWAACIGMCDQGPAMLVNDKVYTRLTTETVRQIVDECRQETAGYATQRAEERLV